MVAHRSRQSARPWQSLCPRAASLPRPDGPPVAACRLPPAGPLARQVRQLADSSLQQSVQTYWRHSRQKWNVLANASLDVATVVAASSSPRGERLPNKPSLPLGSSGGLASGSADV